MRRAPQAVVSSLQGLARRWRGAVFSLRRRYRGVDILVLAAERFGSDQMTLYAGNFAYSAFLALAPLLLLLLSVLGFVFHSSPQTMARAVDALRERLPEIGTVVEDAAGGVERYRGLLGIAGLAGLAWASSRIVQSLKLGFARIWGYRPHSSMAGRLKALPLALLLTAAAVLGMAFSLVATSSSGQLGGNLGAAFSFLLSLLSPLASIALSALILTLLYRLGARGGPGWAEALKAALSASLILEALQVVLGFYFRSLSGSQAFLGSLGIALGVIIWLYFVGLVLFLGAELAAALQERILSPASPGPATRIHPESDEEKDEFQ